MRGLLLLLITISVASCIVLVFLGNMLIQREPSLPFTKTFEIADKLNTQKEIRVDLELKVLKVPSQLRFELENATLKFNITRIILYWEAPSPKLDKYTGELWSIWGTGSECGVSSWIIVEDDGLRLKIYYVNTTLSTVHKISLIEEDRIKLCFVASECRIILDDIEVYRFSGYREIHIVELLIKE